MREILFRGKREDNGEWVFGAFCGRSSKSPFGEMQENPNIIKYDDPFDGYWFDVISSTVGQYTGLTDKKGVKIFEGDIVRTKEYGKDAHGLNHVGFDTFQIRHYGYAVYLENSKRKFMLTPSTAQTCEIIGNVHDNPELLEESNA